VIVAAAELHLFGVGFDARADNFRLAEVERRAGHGRSNRSDQAPSTGDSDRIQFQVLRRDGAVVAAQIEVGVNW